MNYFALQAFCLALALATPTLAQRAASFAPGVTYSAGLNSYPVSVAIADVNKDGQPDLLTANYMTSTAGVLLGTGAGTFGAATTLSLNSSYNPDDIAVADVNGDGNLDLIVVSVNSYAAGVMLGTGTGSFGAATLFNAAAPCYRLAVADVNGDGKSDLLTANGSANTVSVLLGTGTGSFGAATLFNTGAGSNPRSIAVADVNGDGKPDLLTANRSNNTVGVLLGTGTGGFGAISTYSTSAYSTPYDLAVADVNGDGNPDLLTANQTGTAGVLLGTGTGTFGPVSTYGAISVPYAIVVADVNADGQLDLLTANVNTTISVLLGTGTGSFGLAARYNTGSGGYPLSAAVGDVNGDGKPDVVTANGLTYDLSVLLNTTTTLSTRAMLPGISASLSPNPAGPTATLTTTGLPAAAHTVEATMLSPVGQPMRRFRVPVARGVATATVSTGGLVGGLYLLQLSALDAQGTVLGMLPTQRFSVE